MLQERFKDTIQCSAWFEFSLVISGAIDQLVHLIKFSLFCVHLACADSGFYDVVNFVYR